jgi:hypothetical protein
MGRLTDSRACVVARGRGAPRTSERDPARTPRTYLLLTNPLLVRARRSNPNARA